ncbi:TonB-dependent receptor [uncultured Bacteroides sp.]|uniref:SusC/RagA family TonB-linked outer membrane protein n=1 Tax=uncultured Bacteroides sp. TaxID=162156 RepID=UPI002AA8DA27|nr:TonB-dependent receptor [uncultured Bacteroides sp.]
MSTFRKKKLVPFLILLSKRLCIVIVMSLFTIVSYAQTNKSISGVVTDESGESIIGANVMVVGNKALGTITDMNGCFKLSVPVNSTLKISYVGYFTKRIKTDDNLLYKIVMEEDAAQLEEVVVVGYGTQKKATLTGSVVAVNNERLAITKDANTQNMLTGKLPGLRVIQKTSEPGVFTNQFDIRGLGSPLLVVDGVPRGDLPRMDSNDIESISILKDASAAIYGVRAANGVVLVTTKSGEKGKAKIEYSMYYGIQTPAEMLRPINAYDRAILYNETTMRNTTTPSKTYDDNYFEQLKNGEMPDTDWYDEVLNSTASQQQHNLSISGGNDKLDYYVNFGYNSQGSFFKTNSSNYTRYNLRSNLNSQITKNLKIGVQLNMIMDETDRLHYPTTDIFSYLWRSRPNDPVYANNVAPYYYHSDNVPNVVAMIDPDLSGYVTNKKNIFQSNMSVDYSVPNIKGLSAKFMFSYDKTYDDNTDFQREYNEYRYVASNDSYQAYLMNGKTYLNRFFDNSYSKLWNLSLNYDRVFIDKHHVGAMLLYEESYNQGYNFNASRYFDIPVPYLFAGNAENQVGNGSGLSEGANRALVGRLNYDFMSKYMFEFSFRYDGSSKFPEGKQWGFFPSILLGYRLSEEPFIKENIPLISNLKLRGSWGRLGDDSASSYQFVEGFDYPQSTNHRSGIPQGYVFGDTFVNALGFRNAPNPDITWFTSTMKNIGADVDFDNGLFGLSVDLFQRDRDGLLATPSVVVPGTFGVGISQANMNADRTKGFEVELRHHNRIGNFVYNATGFVSMTRTMQTKIIQPDRANSYDYWRNNLVNRYNDIWFGKGSAGQYQTYEEIANSVYSDATTLPGDPIYEDWNGDGVIDDSDKHPIATSTNPNADFSNRPNYPLMNFGLTLSGQWKGVDFNLLFQGAAMSYVSYGEQLLSPLAWDGNALGLLFDRWHPADSNKDPYDPSNVWVSGYYPYGKVRAEDSSEFNIQNGAYLRLKSIELGYTLPKFGFLKDAGVKNLRLYVNAYNLFTITKVRGVDPEKPSESSGYLYPLNRTFNFGGTITF